MGNRIAEAALTQLENDKFAIEEEIGEALMWNASPENRDKVIALYKMVDFSDRNMWLEYCDWLVDFVEKFRKAFIPRVKQLTLTTAISL